MAPRYRLPVWDRELAERAARARQAMQGARGGRTRFGTDDLGIHRLGAHPECAVATDLGLLERWYAFAPEGVWDPREPDIDGWIDVKFSRWPSMTIYRPWQRPVPGRAYVLVTGDLERRLYALGWIDGEAFARHEGPSVPPGRYGHKDKALWDVPASGLRDYRELRGRLVPRQQEFFS